jgi:hypothetical protein
MILNEFILCLLILVFDLQRFNGIPMACSALLEMLQYFSARFQFKNAAFSKTKLLRCPEFAGFTKFRNIPDSILPFCTEKFKDLTRILDKLVVFLFANYTNYRLISALPIGNLL